MTSTEFASYIYDAAGRMTGITQQLWASRTVQTGTTTSTELFQTPITWSAGYDSRSRLTSFTRAGAETRYTYDGNSNRLTALDSISATSDLDAALDGDRTQTTAQTLNIENTSNRLLGFTQTVTSFKAGKPTGTVTTPVTYTVDANGAMTSDGLRTYEYDAGNRLAKVKILRNGEAAHVRYLHNALGQRVFKSEPESDQTLPNEKELGQDFITWLRKNFGWLFAKGNAAKTSLGQAFIYGDGEIPAWALLGEYDNGSASSKGTAEYIWLPMEDGSAIPIGMYRSGSFYAIHTDHLGTPRLVTDSANKPVWQWPYSGFGANEPTGVLSSTTSTTGSVAIRGTRPAIDVSLRFPGQIKDQETGLNDNFFRTYDPKVRGGYIQPDLIGLRGGLNVFSYVDNDPLDFGDPLGLMKVFEADNGVSFHAYPGTPAGGNEHARAGTGESYHMHLQDSQGREARMSTETWKPLTPEDDRVFRSSKQMQQACASLTDGQMKFFDRVNRQIFHRGVPTDKQLMRLLQIRLGGRFGGGRGGE